MNQRGAPSTAVVTSLSKEKVFTSLAKASVSVGGICGLLWLNNRPESTTSISLRSQKILRKSQGYVAGSFLIGSLPILLTKRAGYEKAYAHFYRYLLENRWFGYSMFAGTVVLFGVTYFTQKEKKREKHALWAASSLAAGIWLAPLVFLPKGIRTIATTYTVALTAPLALTTTMAKNYVFLNLAALFLCLELALLFINFSLQNIGSYLLSFLEQ